MHEGGKVAPQFHPVLTAPFLRVKIKRVDLDHFEEAEAE